jgi:hypothetical protein
VPHRGSAWRLLLASALTMMIVAGCGGGTDADPEPLAAGIAFAQDVGSIEAESAPGVSIDALLLKAERRVSRSVVEYDFELRLKNSGAALEAVTVTLVGAGGGATIVDGEVAAGSLAAGATLTPADTVTIRQDRTQPFAPAQLQWLIGAALPPGSATAAIVYDNAVPAGIRATITQVNTFIDSAAFGTVDVPVAAGSTDTVALALNDADTIVLAAVQLVDGKLVLGADSTALALVRIVFGPEPEGITVAQLNAAIRGAADYPALVAAIDAALAANVPPSTAPPVLQQVAAVMQQAIAILKNAVGNAQAAATKRRQALPETVAELPLPYSLLGTTGSTPSVHLTGSAINTVSLVNSLPIYWDAAANGTTVSLPPSALTSVALGLISPWLGPSPVDVPDAGGPAFTLKLFQSKGSRKENISSVARGILKLALDRVTKDTPAEVQCEGALLAVALASDRLDQLARSPSAENFFAYLRDTATLQALDWGPALRTCFPTHPGRWGLFIGRYIVAISKYIEPILAVGGTIGLGYQMYTVSTHWSTDREIGICQTDGFFFGRNIANCAARFDVEPKPRALVPGARITPSYRAYDVKGFETGLPSALEFSSSDPSVVGVVWETGEISANRAGRVDVLIREPAIPAASTVGIEVVDPVLSPATATAKVGDRVTFKLLDGKGQDVETKNAQIVWSSLDKTVADIDPLSLLFGNQWADVIALAPGTTTIVAWNLVSGQMEGARLDVGPVEPRGSFDGTTTMSYKWCSGVTMRVYGSWKIDIYPDGTHVLNYLDGITQYIDASPCFTNTAVFRDTIVLEKQPGSVGGVVIYFGFREYPFVGEGGVPAGTRVWVNVWSSGSTYSGYVEWMHFNASLSGQVGLQVVPDP